MSDRKMLSAQVSENSALWVDFQEYQERNGFESRSEAMRAALRGGIDADRDRDPEEPTVEEVRNELRDELKELRDQQRTPLEEGGYLLAAVVAGTSPLVGLVLMGVVSPLLAFAGGLVVAFAGLLVGAVTKIFADSQLRAGGGVTALSGVSD